MRIIRTIARIISVGAGVLFLWPPIVSLMAQPFVTSHKGASMVIAADGLVLAGWQFWGVMSLLAVMGVALVMVGIYALRSRKPPA